ncbi:unnamed protein product [Prunus armeniaca]
MDKRRWEDLEMDCLVKVLEKVGKESLLLDVPFVCKLWYKATLNPSCCECIEVWPWDVSECPNFQNLMDRFVSEYQIDGDRCSVTALLKFVINRSSGNATVLKLPKCCTVECPGLVTLSLPGDALDSKHTNLELIGKWKHLEVLSLDLVMLDARYCSGFNDDEISKLGSHISKFMCEGFEFPKFLRGMDNLVLHVGGYSFHQHVEENWDEMLNDLHDAFNDLGDKE